MRTAFPKSVCILNFANCAKILKCWILVTNAVESQPLHLVEGYSLIVDVKITRVFPKQAFQVL